MVGTEGFDSDIISLRCAIHFVGSLGLPYLGYTRNRYLGSKPVERRAVAVHCGLLTMWNRSLSGKDMDLYESRCL